MSGLFITDSLKKSSSTTSAAWATREIYFQELQVFATIQLSRYGTSNNSQFGGSAETYIVSSQTPMTTAGPVSFPSRRDNTVYLKTDHLEFNLEVINAFASAHLMVFDNTRKGLLDRAKIVDQFDLALFDEQGHVVGLHGVSRFDGGADPDLDAISEGALARARAQHVDAVLDLAPVDLSEVPPGADFRIDPATRRPTPTDAS